MCGCGRFTHQCNGRLPFEHAFADAEAFAAIKAAITSSDEDDSDEDDSDDDDSDEDDSDDDDSDDDDSDEDDSDEDDY